MFTFKRVVNYYETDKMGITHHSNYIRWMEEARVAYLDAIDWPYQKCEEKGIMSPVIGINCKYVKSTTFADEVSIDCFIMEFTGLRYKVGYIMKNKDGEKVCEGSSEHCFIGISGKLIRIKNEFPEIYEVFSEEARKYKEECENN